MSQKMPWYKRCPSDWQRGTRKHAMSFELRGFYSECLDAMWELQAQLPKDAKVLAMMLGTNPRLARSLMRQLVDLGKMIETAKGFYNPRMMADILDLETIDPIGDFEPVSISIQPPFELGSSLVQPPIKVESALKVPKNPMISRATLESESEEEREVTPLPPSGAEPIDALEAFEAYNETALRCGLPQSSKLTPRRSKAIRARLKLFGLDGWRRALANIEKSAFLCGQTPEHFRADLDFVCQAKSFERLHDGGYGNGRKADQPKSVVKMGRYGNVRVEVPV